jgi:hypothetical protein
MGTSAAGRKRYLCDCPSGRRNVAHLENCKYFTATGAKRGDWRGHRQSRS